MKLWTFKTNDKYALVINCDEIVMIQVPDLSKPGCEIVFKNNETVIFPDWDGDDRQTKIENILKELGV